MKKFIARLTVALTFGLIAAPVVHAEDTIKQIQPATIVPVKNDPCAGC